MHVDIAPRRIVMAPGHPAEVVISLSNDSELIVGCSLQVLGADPSWIAWENSEPRLFPHETTAVRLWVTLPDQMAAGDRRIVIQVRDLTDASKLAIEDLVLEIPAEPHLVTAVDPVTVTAGRSAHFQVIVTNEGNGVQRGRLVPVDPEAKLRFTIESADVELPPGASVTVPVKAKGRRKLLGDHRLRPFELHVVDADPAPTMVLPPTQAVFVQRPVFTRGLTSLFGLLLTLSVFAVVIVLALGSVVQRSTADRDLALQVAQARDGGATTGSSEMGGTVLDLSTGLPAPAMSVAAFAADDTATALKTVATDSAGTFALAGLPAGSYLLRIQGAGYSDVWYPAAPAPGDAQQVEVSGDKPAANLVAVVGGAPAVLSGTVTGDDVSAATLLVQLPLQDGVPVLEASVDQQEPVGDDGVPEGAVVATIPIGSAGEFEAGGLPSPAVYDLVVRKTGYATTVQRVDVAAGETRKNVNLALRVGDGTVSGQVSGLDGPIGGATITATSGQVSVETVSLTQDEVGSFVLRNLPTPGNYTLTASADGYASASVAVSLAEAQTLTGLSLVLGTDTASLAGKVRVDGAAASGVAVTVSDGSLTLSTVTQSTPAGAWQVTGLRVPSTYTVTFSRAGLESQVMSVIVDGFGKVTAGAPNARSVNATLRLATASLSGVVRQSSDGASPERVRNATVTISSGGTQRVVTTQSSPASDAGYYRVDGLTPGTYTVTFTRPGTSPSSEIVKIGAGESRTLNVVLIAPARIKGRAIGSTETAGLTVNLYLAGQYGTASAPVATTTTDGDGAYAFAEVAAPENYIIEMRTSQGGSVRGTTPVFSLAASQAITKDVNVG